MQTLKFPEKKNKIDWIFKMERPSNSGFVFKQLMKPMPLLSSDKLGLHIGWVNYQYNYNKFRLPCKIEENPPLLPSDGDAFISEYHVEHWPDISKGLEIDLEFLKHETSKETIDAKILQLENLHLDENREDQEFFENQQRFHFKDLKHAMLEEFEDYKVIPKPEEVEILDDETLDDLLLAEEADIVENEIRLPPYLERDVFDNVKHFR